MIGLILMVESLLGGFAYVFPHQRQATGFTSSFNLQQRRVHTTRVVFRDNVDAWNTMTLLVNDIAPLKHILTRHGFETAYETNKEQLCTRF